MATIEKEKINRKRKFEDINIENEDEKLTDKDNDCTLNENDTNRTLKFEHDIKTKLDICNNSESTNTKNSWSIKEHFKYKYPTLREDSVKRWLKLDSQYFKSQLEKQGPQAKRSRKNTQGYFHQLELMLIDEIIQREKSGLIRDIEWTRNRAAQLYEQHKNEFGWQNKFDASQGWFYKFLKRHGAKLNLRKPTTNKKMTFDEYIVHWHQWIDKERLFLLEIKNKIQLNKLIQIQDIIYNVDEIPIVLQSNKQKKQLCTIDADMVQVRQAHLTRNPKYRSATIAPIIAANGNIPIWLKPLLLLPSRPEGPTKKILDKRVITYMNENAYLTQAAWDYYIKYLKSLFKNNTAIIYVDNLSTHFAHIDTSRPITSYLTSSTTTSSASKSTNVSFHLSSLIPNSTQIMQPLDQHVGRFIQVNIHNKYSDLILSQEKEYESSNEIKKIGIAELREKTA